MRRYKDLREALRLGNSSSSSLSPSARGTITERTWKKRVDKRSECFQGEDRPRHVPPGMTQSSEAWWPTACRALQASPALSCPLCTARWLTPSMDFLIEKLFFVMLLLFFTKRSLPMSLSLRLPCQWIAGESCSTLWICRSSSRIWQRLFPSLPSVFRFEALDSLYDFEKWSPQGELRWLCYSGQGTGVRGEVNVGQSKGTAGEQTF